MRVSINLLLGGSAEMNVLAAVASLLVASSQIGIVSLQFYKDSCAKFLQSEPADQDMYIAWAAGHIKRDFRVDLNSATISQPLRNYCAAHPDIAFVDATAAVKDQLAGGAKP